MQAGSEIGETYFEQGMAAWRKAEIRLMREGAALIRIGTGKFRQRVRAAMEPIYRGRPELLALFLDIYEMDA